MQKQRLHKEPRVLGQARLGGLLAEWGFLLSSKDKAGARAEEPQQGEGLEDPDFAE